MLLSVVIPAFGSRCLPELVGRVFEALADHQVEIILVDDDSPTGDVWEDIARMAAADPRVLGIRLMRNAGQHAATLTGLAASRGAVVFTLDDDLQHLPEHLPRLLPGPEADVVVAQLNRATQTGWRRMTGMLKDGLDALWLRHKPAGLRFSSFRAMRRSVVEAIITDPPARAFLPALLLRATNRIEGVALPLARRSTGASTYTLGRQLRVVRDMLAARPGGASGRSARHGGTERLRTEVREVTGARAVEIMKHLPPWITLASSPADGAFGERGTGPARRPPSDQRPHPA